MGAVADNRMGHFSKVFERRAAADALGMAGVVAAYPAAGALRLVTRPDASGQAAALAERHGLEATGILPSLDDAAQSLMHSTGAGW